MILILFSPQFHISCLKNAVDLTQEVPNQIWHLHCVFYVDYSFHLVDAHLALLIGFFEEEQKFIDAAESTESQQGVYANCWERVDYRDHIPRKCGLCDARNALIILNFQIVRQKRLDFSDILSSEDVLFVEFADQGEELTAFCELIEAERADGLVGLRRDGRDKDESDGLVD